MGRKKVAKIRYMLFQDQRKEEEKKFRLPVSSGGGVRFNGPAIMIFYFFSASIRERVKNSLLANGFTKET